MDMYTDDLISSEELNEKIGWDCVKRLNRSGKRIEDGIQYHLTKGEQTGSNFK